jgi:hypothetical protein
MYCYQWILRFRNMKLNVSTKKTIHVLFWSENRNNVQVNRSLLQCLTLHRVSPPMFSSSSTLHLFSPEIRPPNESSRKTDFAIFLLKVVNGLGWRRFKNFSRKNRLQRTFNLDFLLQKHKGGVHITYIFVTKKIVAKQILT